MAIHPTTQAPAFTPGAYLFPPMVDQIVFRLFLKHISLIKAWGIAGILGSATLILLAQDRRTWMLCGATFLAYKITTFYFLTRAPITMAPPRTREERLAALGTLVDLLIPQIEKHLSVEGIYRESGKHTTIQDAIASFNSGRTLPNLTEAHDLVGVLKAQLRSLDPPLLQPYYQKFKAAASKKTDKDKRLALIMACQEQTAEKPIFKKIIDHLNKVHKAHADNKMKSINLATCLTPALFSLNFDEIPSFSSFLVTLIENPTILSQSAP